MKILFCGTMLYFLLGSVLLFQDNDFLDLTKATLAGSERSIGRGQGKGYTGMGHTREIRVNPFKITLLGLNKNSYQIGDEAVFDVEIENITKNPVVIPWSADYNKVKPDEEKTPPGYLEANLSLILVDGISGEQLTIGQGLYGSELLPGSLKKLEPKHPVRIRTPSRLFFLRADTNSQILSRLPLRVEMQARYIILNGEYRPVISSKGISIELKKRQE